MAKNPAIIYNTVFKSFKSNKFARQIGAHEDTFSKWIHGARPMPPAKERQLAYVLTKQVERINQLIEYLIANSARPKRRSLNGNPLARAWHTPGKSPKIKNPATPAKL